MAAPMRSGHQQDGQGHRARVADSCKGATTAPIRGQQPNQPNQSAAGQPQHQPPTANFEYDDNEWDIGIGDLIIDLDADIEKTNEQQLPSTIGATMSASAGGGSQAKNAATAKMHIEHSATADKGLKMKIKRTKPGSKSSEAKHEIVKSNEQNGIVDPEHKNSQAANKHTPNSGSAQSPLPLVTGSGNQNQNVTSGSSGNVNQASKRGSSGHRRDKARDKHNDRNGTSAPPAQPVTGSNADKSSTKPTNASGLVQTPQCGAIAAASDINGIIRAASVFPASSGPGPPPPSPGPPASPAAATAQGSAAKPEQAKVASANGNVPSANSVNADEHRTNSATPPPAKKAKCSDSKETVDVCVGTSVGTITEPDCLGPCEPGTSVTLEGIVWHETEGGVLVVNVTWRGKTYVGTLLDCTRHDWAPPRFCDSPTSDLDSRTPKGRETRSSVHSKLRNGGGVKGGRRGVANGAGPSNAPASPTPFVPPRPDNKRKGRAGEEETPAGSNKKTKVVIPAPVVPIVVTPAPCGSPPPSPVLLECPEPNCSKKYKNVNGLKYHQSHAHGSVAEDEDTKDVTSMSENDESNIEAPSPVTPVKSPDKSQDSPPTPIKKEGSNSSELPALSNTEETSSPPSPDTPPSVHELPPTSLTSPVVAAAEPTCVKPQPVVKPAILRFGATTPEEYPQTPTAVFGKPPVQASPVPQPTQLITARPASEPSVVQPENVQPQSFTNQLQSHISPQQFTQPPNVLIPNQTSSNPQLSPQSPTKLTQFKVKPASALMPEEKKPPQSLPQNGANLQKPQNFKKKNRKSPSDSPHSMSPQDAPVFLEQSGRDEVQSPAYSDISDDGAPVNMEGDVDKNKNPDKKTESGQGMPHMGQYGMYPYFSQPHQYVVPNQESNKPKEPEKSIEKPAGDKEVKKEGEYPQKMLQQHYYPYGYMPGYPYNMDNYGGVPIQDEKHNKDDRVKESPSPIEQPVKQPTPIPTAIQVPKPKPVESKDKPQHQNDNHQIIKESIEMKNQMNPYMYSRQSQSQQQPMNQHHHRDREEEARRYYVYEQQRRKEQQQQQQQQQQQLSDHKSKSVPSPNLKKDIKVEEKKEKEVKQEGVKPTMETQGPPPPPTSQYAYIHPSYMQGAHYGALPFDPSHPMYRGIMVPGPYGSSPYLHPQIPRYHAPEDLSRAQPPSKALDMLQHHAQYYSSHKIHELQERAIKSPTPKTSVASSSPSTNPPAPAPISAPPTTQAPSTTPSNGKQTPGENKDSRSPPPQRHVHTHHHTHVGLGYPIYGAGPYGAAVLASQQAAAVTVINPYPTK